MTFLLQFFIHHKLGKLKSYPGNKSATAYDMNKNFARHMFPYHTDIVASTAQPMLGLPWASWATALFSQVPLAGEVH